MIVLIRLKPARISRNHGFHDLGQCLAPFEPLKIALSHLMKSHELVGLVVFSRFPYVLSFQNPQ